MGKSMTVILVVTCIAFLTVLRQSAYVYAHDDELLIEDREDNMEHDAPEIDTAEEYVVLPFDESRNFTCKSHKPILWQHYAASYYWDPPNVRTASYDTEDPDKPYGSVLIITDATAATVGRYYCVHKETWHEEKGNELDEMVAAYLASTIYIYVKDDEQPLVPVLAPVFRVNQYESFVIPCKPTHPDVEVELSKDLDGDLVEDYEFSKTQGYRVNFHSLEHGGPYLCQQRNNPNHKIEFGITIIERCEFSAASSRLGLRLSPDTGRKRLTVPSKSFSSLNNGDGITVPAASTNYERSGNRRLNRQQQLNTVETLQMLPLKNVPRVLFGQNFNYLADGALATDTGSEDLKPNLPLLKRKRSAAEDYEDNATLFTNAYTDLVSVNETIVNNTELGSTSASGAIEEDIANATVAGNVLVYDVHSREPTASPTRPSILFVNPHDGKSTILPLNFSHDSDEALGDVLLKPIIESDTNNHVPLGRRIRLLCKANISKGIYVDLAWKVPPNLKPVAQGGRVKIGKLNVFPDPQYDHREFVSRELIVEKATREDNGTYRCEVFDISNKMNYHNYKLHVRTSSGDFVELTEENKLPHISVRRNQNGKTSPIIIVLNYQSYPSNIDYYWLKDDDELKTSLQGKHEFEKTPTYLKLTINDPTVFDTGSYTAVAMAGNATDTYSIFVNVSDKPTVHMDSRFAKPGELVNFVCRSIGYPRPDISFMFQPCLEIPWKNCSIALTNSAKWDSSGPDIVSEHAPRMLAETKKEAVITSSRTYSTITDQPGIVYCKASNSEGSEIQQADLLLSDLSDTIVLERVQPKEMITTGDRVSYVCSALVYNHTSDIVFVHNDHELLVGDGVTISYSSQSFAWEARLNIEDVTPDQSGEIYCHVKTVNGTIESRATHMKVVAPVAPQLLSDSGKRSLTVEMHAPLKLDCDVVGTPDPKVTWLKDGAPIELDENSTRIQMTRTSLTFEYLKPEEFGLFKCVAKNKEGAIEKEWMVDVRTTVVKKSLIYAIVALLLLLLVAIVMVSLFYCKKKKEVKTMKAAGLANFEEGNLGCYNPDVALDEQADLLPYNSEYEFPKERLKLGKQLGTGAFGVVMKATAAGIMVNEDETTVAVKMVKKQTDNEVMRALISELKIMVHLGQHLNVVNLLGAVTKNIAKRELMVIVEYCPFGNVQNFLLKSRPHFIDQINQETGEIDPTIEINQLRWSKSGYHYNSGLTQQYVDPKKQVNSKGYVRHSGLQNMGMVDSCNTETTAMTSVEVEDLNSINSNEPLWRSNYRMDYKGPVRSVNTTDLVCWASQIASGMEYLASRKVLHGDLAARNILLCDDNVVKICDFGLARSMYKSDNYKKKGEAPLPFKWLALECISDNVFSTYSDVWAYGIVLWELFSLGKVPYPGMEANQELYNKLRDGYRMDKPQFSNQDIYDIMLNCWNVKPDSRPSFKDLKSRFNAMLPDEMRDHYLELNEPYLAMNAEKMERGDTDYLANLGPPEELAPSAPNYVNGIILPLPPISEIRHEKDYLKMSGTKSDSEDSQFDFTSFNSQRHSPTIRNNLDTSPPNGSKRHNKKGLPEEIPMLSNNRPSSVTNGYNSDSEHETISPKPRERTSKHSQEPEYMNVKGGKLGPRPTSDELAGVNPDAISNPGYIALSTVEEKRC